MKDFDSFSQNLDITQITKFVMEKNGIEGLNEREINLLGVAESAFIQILREYHSWSEENR